MAFTAPAAVRLRPTFGEHHETASARADSLRNLRRAEFGLSLVWGHGLHGYPTNQSKAADWRAKALANRRFMPITQYTAAFNGQSSRVNIINVPTDDVTLAEATAVDACIAWLSGGDNCR